MDSTDLSESTSEGDDEPSFDDRSICALQTSPDRTVFTEDDNEDGWIATDLTVDLLR